MQFEFDDNKSRYNKEKHGIDFVEAQKLWKDPQRVQIPSRLVDEPQFLLLAMLDGIYWSAILLSEAKALE